MKDNEKRKNDYLFGSFTGVGNKTKRKLLKRFGTTKSFFKAPEREILSLPYLKEKELKALLHYRHFLEADKAWESFLSTGVSFVTIGDDDYPKTLSQVYDPPFLLYYRGSLPERNESITAIVGSRRASNYGLRTAYDIATVLAGNGISVVSGMALGIDAAAHRGAIEGGGKTYAFLGNGIDICYPDNHRELYAEIVKHGAVISELPPGTQPLKQNFPARNRLISGLASRVIVVEAAEKSGSLITADFALEQGRDIYAVPGRIDDTLSAGTNRLIYEGAGIILSKEQLIADFLGIRQGLLSDPRAASEDADSEAPKRPLLDPDERTVYGCFDFYAKGLEEACRDSGMELFPFISVVMRLCERGLLKETFKNEYVKA